MKPKRYIVLLSSLLLFLTLANAGGNEKYKIKTVRFEGNQVFSDSRLHTVMISRPSTFLNPSVYHEAVFQEDLKMLQLFYHQNGYLEAEITHYSVSIDSVKKQVHISIQIHEGELTYIEGVTIFGNKAFSDELIMKKIKINGGDPFNRKKIEEATLALLTLYAENGFLDAEINPDVRINRELHRAIIDFQITERNQYRIGEIRISGNNKTDPQVIRRELNFKSGEIVNYTRLLQSQRKLYLTGLFQSVFITPQKSSVGDSNLKDILIDLKENESIEFSVAAGYGTVDKVRGKAEVYNHNLMGTARKIGLLGRVSFIYRSIEASFTEPWTLGIPWKTDINLFAEYKEEPGYDFSRVGGRITYGRNFLKRSNANLSYRHENVGLKNLRVREVPEKLRNNVRSLKLSLIYDTRDNLFNPASGVYLELSNELAGSFLKGDISFFRTIAQFKSFQKLGRETVVGSNLELGLIDVEGGISRVPLNERFYSGGPNSIRGFNYQEVGPLDDRGFPIGGAFKVVFNIVEIRQTFYKMIGGVAFLDAGNVWTRKEHFNFRDIRLAAGMGLRVNTPIGLARLDYGFNLNPYPGEPSGKLYFSMGQAF
ncbi:MAG: outer membrane protein assembly factor BamA [Calditrichia bacterium]